MILFLALIAFLIVAMWKMFTKAGKPGWAAFVPFYNQYVMVQIAGLDIIWFVLTFIPIANIIAAFKINIGIAQNFGKSAGFGVGLVFLPFIFVPILGFGSATYGGVAPAAVPPVQAPPPPQA
ncbi:MAG TPA: signal peptidase I [Phycisphaerales bacterium]|nr:signal peptidase I [Phycisphaerales bacterium]